MNLYVIWKKYEHFRKHPILPLCILNISSIYKQNEVDKEIV